MEVDDDAVRPVLKFKVGDRVRTRTGPGPARVGVVEWLNGSPAHQHLVRFNPYSTGAYREDELESAPSLEDAIRGTILGKVGIRYNEDEIHELVTAIREAFPEAGL